MNPPTTTSLATPPLWLRLLRNLITLVLCLAVTLLMLFALAGWDQSLFSSIKAEDSIGKTLPLLTGIFFLILPSGLCLLASRRRWLTWRVLAAGWAFVLPTMVWLAWDDPVLRHPLPSAESAPVSPCTEQSYALLMRYSKQQPSAEARALDKVKWVVPTPGLATFMGTDKRFAFVAQNRAGLEADWATLKPERLWLDELNAFDRIGDLTPWRTDANIMTFTVWRTLSQRACGIALLQALDGHGDEAISTLLPILEISRKLQPSSRYLVRSMIAVVMERISLETAGLVLDRASVSPATRARLTAALSGGNAPELARHLILTEYPFFLAKLQTMKFGDATAGPDTDFRPFRQPLNFLGRLLVNPNTTANLHGDFLHAMADLAGARQLDQLSVLNKEFANNPPRKSGMKNVGGWLMLMMVIPDYSGVIKNYWKMVDLREALLKRLATTPAS